MWTIGTVFSAFQVKAAVGPDPGKCVELSYQQLEGKSPIHGRRTELASHPFTRGTVTLLAA
jgi:hypothetical protein